MTDISLAPLVSALSPLINAAVSGAVIGIGGLIFALLAKWTGIAFSPDTQAQFEKAVDFEVNRAVAASENNLATGSFSAGNPLVGSITRSVVATAPALIEKIGLTPAQIEQSVIAAIGRSQRGAIPK